jgi:HlyD family secretion protein
MTQIFTVGTPELRQTLRRPLITGFAICMAFFGGLGAWSAMAPLSSAALGPGVVSPDGNRRTIQHLEGGIVEKLLVQDGSRVEAGDPLVILEDKAARSAHDVALGQYRQLLAIEGRLLAERDGETEPRFAEELLNDAADPAVAAILVAQRQLMQLRQDALAHKRTLLLQKIAQINEEIAGLRAQVTSQSRQLTLIAEEVKGVTHLLNKGLERKPRLLALQRSQAEIAGLRAANEAAIARALQAIGEAEQQITTLDAERQEEIGTRLAEVTGELAAARDRLVAAADVLRRVVITAPIAGTVVQLKAHTVGGVVGSGQPILDIVPRDEDLLIDARIAPTDIDVVREGLPAQVVLSAYKQRNLPRLEGRVRSVSADRIVDEKTSTPYYLVRIEVDREHLAKVAPDVELMPGMPAEAMVMTGHRTALSYLTQPFLDSLRRSMRES